MDFLRRHLCRKGQTTIEYLLAMVMLVIVFALIYKIVGNGMVTAFRGGAKVIVRQYN